MRNEIIAGIGGLVVGHILWLTAISLATDSGYVNQWVLVVAAVSFLIAVAAGLLGRRKYQQKAYEWAAFLWLLPVSPVLFSIAVLGVTYL
ncbi:MULTISPECIES: hypothetical protein [Mycolicibacterium]|uniref:Probable conserved membrane protein n=1 Tax=Mycolicibacterium brisbanense TaxID=146020 RepID=A0A100VYQ3_9MYCO|nr:hypothetical protein [Mycolicibacterium brisbanense]MCV7158622.1 hypothetical protein [Mycolicibacterium brisbanense]GAS88471.1 probable conserved membrane protein [Mycolicibacterium brisbanense]